MVSPFDRGGQIKRPTQPPIYIYINININIYIYILPALATYILGLFHVGSQLFGAFVSKPLYTIHHYKSLFYTNILGSQLYRFPSKIEWDLTNGNLRKLRSSY